MKHSKEMKEKIIKNYMKKLDISYEEAIDLYAFDYLGAENEYAQNLTAKFKESGIRIQGSLADRHEARGSRTTKANPTKAGITTLAVSALEAISASNITHVPEKTIDFIYKSKSYTLKLTKHNTYKGIKETKAAKRKVDLAKAEIISSIVSSLTTDSTITDILVQTETAINFNIAETNYTLALTAHRS